MANVFYHIPRTSGSTIWHSLAQKAINQQFQVVDLYSSSIEKYQSPFCANKVLSDLTKITDMSSKKMIIHHHTRQNITRHLNPEEHKYMTIIRDPIERLISEVYHMKQIYKRYGHGEATALIGMKRWFSPTFAEALQDDTLSPDQLLLVAAIEPRLTNTYVTSFWQLLMTDEYEDYRDYPNELSVDFDYLVEAVCYHFYVIASYPNVYDACCYIAHASGIKSFKVEDMIMVANGVEKPVLQEKTLTVLRELNSVDYAFLDCIRQRRMFNASTSRSLFMPSSAHVASR